MAFKEHTTILVTSFFSNVGLCHDFNTCRELRGYLFRKIFVMVHDTIEPKAHPKAVIHRFNMNIACPLLYGIVKKGVV